jgi:hypothetical protein
MVSIPNKSILSMVMKQRYNIDADGITRVKYCIASQKQTIELVNFYHPQSTIALYLTSYGDVSDSKFYFDILSENNPLLKTSSFHSSFELDRAITLAREDYLRFELYYSLLNPNNNPEFYQEVWKILYLNELEFYQKFVLDSSSLEEIYASVIHTPESLELLKELDKIDKPENIEIDITDFDKRVDKVKMVFDKFISKNSNIQFLQTEDCSLAQIVINPFTDYTQDYLIYEGDVIVQKILDADLGEFVSQEQYWMEYIHYLMHVVIDHPCENGFYSCSKQEITECAIYSVMAQPGYDKRFNNNIEIVKSLLPWDIAAVRYSYGMPAREDITYNLFNADGLKSAFDYNIINGSLVTLSNVGNSIIDIKNIDSYTLDLRYDHKSYVTAPDIEFSFYLSYDTEIFKILANQSGSIHLSEEFETSIILQEGCYKLSFVDSIHKGDAIEITCEDSLRTIEIYDFNPYLHNICIGEAEDCTIVYF